MLRGSHLWIGGGDLALLVDQVADAARVAGFGVGAGPVCKTELAVNVTQQFEWKIEFLREGGVGLDAVEADAQDHDIMLFEIGILVAEPAAFDRSARGVGLGIEPEQYFMTAKRREAHRLSVVALHGEIRRLISHL